MKILKSIIHDHEGNMMFFAGVLVLVLLVIFAGVFEYVRIYTIASNVKTTVRRHLESTAIQTAKDSFQSVKQYSLSDPVVSQSVFEDNLCSDLGLICQDGSYVSGNGNTNRYTLEHLQLSVSVDPALVLTYQFTLQVPVYYVGIRVDTAEIPMTVTATYQYK